MKIKYLLLYLFVIFCTGNVLCAQRQAIDTSYYADGSINYIRYIGGESIGYATIRYFKKSFNPSDKDKQLTDTIFRSFADNNKLAWYQGPTRIFFSDSSYVTILKLTKYGSMKDKVFNNIIGGYNFTFGELNNLELDLSFNKDTAITNFGIIGDSIRFVNIGFENKGSHFSSDTILGNYFNCGKFGEIVIVFDKNNLLKKVFLYKGSNKNSTYYEFYDNYYCKKYGHYQGNIPIGQWCEYHKNGNISSYGKYLINDTTDNFFKDGIWKYFDAEGKLTKEELFNKGQLIK